MTVLILLLNPAVFIWWMVNRLIMDSLPFGRIAQGRQIPTLLRLAKKGRYRTVQLLLFHTFLFYD